MRSFRAASAFAFLAIVAASTADAAPTALPVDQVGNVGQQSAIAIGNDGFPVTSYLADSGGGQLALKVAKCGAPDCSVGNVVTTVAAAFVGSNGSIVVPIDGRPLLAFEQSGVVRLLRCGNAACSAGNESVALPGVEDPAVALGLDGFAIVAARDAGSIRVTKCHDAACSTSTQTTLVEPQSGPLGMAVAPDGNPVLAMALEGLGVRVAKCANSTCSGVVAFHVIDDFGVFKGKPDVAVPADGIPVAAYTTGGSAADPFRFVRVARCRSIDCSDGASINQLAATDNSSVSIALGTDGKPLIAFQGLGSGAKIGLVVAKCGSNTCASDTTYSVIDSKPASGEWSDIAAATTGNPVVSYYDASNLDAFVARCDNATCQSAMPVRALGQANEPLAFVTGFEAAQVAIIDTVSRALVSLIDVGLGPEGVAFSRDGQKAYVTNVSSGNVSAIDVRTREVERTITTGAPGTAPRGIAVSPDHARLYVANSGTNAVAVIDRASGNVVSSVPVGLGPFGLAITPNGATVITANTNGGSASFVSTATNTLLGTVPVGSQPYGVATSPDGALAYIAVFGANAVTVLDVATRTVITSIPVGIGPFGIAVSKDGTRLYVSDNQNRVSVVDAVARTVIDSIPVGSHPQGVALTPDDKFLFVANQFSDTVQVVDTTTRTVVFTRDVPADPVSLGAFISPTLVRSRQAVEYYHAFFGHYFVTIQEDEIAGLDSGVFVGWARTGQTFNVYDLDSGYLDTCRFFTTAFPPKSSHFYTPDAAECDLVKHNPDWTFEKIAFQLRMPVGGTCPEGTVPLYRLYNDGKTGAPNHRYTPSLAIRTQMISQGFVPEDPNTACIPQ